MREIKTAEITDVVERLCIEANEQLPEDIAMYKTIRYIL